MTKLDPLTCSISLRFIYYIFMRLKWLKCFVTGSYNSASGKFCLQHACLRLGYKRRRLPKHTLRFSKSVPSHSLKCWSLFINWIWRNTIQWTFNQTIVIFIQESVSKMSGKCWPFCSGLNVLLITSFFKPQQDLCVMLVWLGRSLADNQYWCMAGFTGR